MQAQQETQMGKPSVIGLGDEGREGSSGDEEENKRGFLKSWPAYRTTAAVTGASPSKGDRVNHQTKETYCPSHGKHHPCLHSQ